MTSDVVLVVKHVLFSNCVEVPTAVLFRDPILYIQHQQTRNVVKFEYERSVCTM